MSVDGKNRQNHRSQIYGSLVVCLGSLGYGATLGYPTRALPQLETEDGFQMNEHMGSWFATIFWICGIFAPTGGSLSSWLGRRKLILFTSPLVAVGWCIIGMAQNRAMLFVGRALASAAIHSYSSSVGVYISETAHPDIRASLVILPSTFITIGALMVWIFGSFLSWRMTAYLMIIPSLVLVLLLSRLPETPYWLIQDGNIGMARKSLQYFRGNEANNNDVNDELNEIRQKHQEKIDKSKHQSWAWILKRIFSNAFLKPFSCVGSLYLITTWHGFNCIMVYMISVLNDTGSSFDIRLGPILIGCIRVAIAVITPLVIRKISPKLLFMMSFFISALAMTALGFMAYLQEYYPTSNYWNYLSWVPITMIILAVMTRSAGIVPILYTLMSELFPTEIRTQAIGITEALYLASEGVGVKLFPEMRNSMGLCGVCLLYASMGYLNVFWGGLTIPDNRGKSLVKVEELYENEQKSSTATAVAAASNR